jgi:deoxyribodipyrimidine photolyase
VDDNPALLNAIEGSTELVCVYGLDSQWRRPDRYQSLPMGRHRQPFLQQSLLLLEGDPVERVLWLVCTLSLRHWRRMHESIRDMNRQLASICSKAEVVLLHGRWHRFRSRCFSCTSALIILPAG